MNMYHCHIVGVKNLLFIISCVTGCLLIHKCIITITKRYLLHSKPCNSMHEVQLCFSCASRNYVCCEVFTDTQLLSS